MINLQFKDLNIEGFQSIGNAKINFENLGTCFIKGVNKYDSKTKSNGSGKSSLLMSIYWCLFGKTPAGIGNDVVNKFVKTGCFVELNVNIEGVNYFIRRSQNHKEYKTNIVIIKDNEDISGRNKSDSDKLIKDILKIDEEVFSQMIFLSQGFANRFAIYTPKARKELLESLYSIDERLENFVNDLKIKESIYKNKLDSISKSMVELHTKINMLNNTVDDNNSRIKHTNVKITELENTKSNVTKDEVTILQLKLDESNYQVERLTDKYNSQNNIVAEFTRKINDSKRSKINIEQEIKQFSTNKICPTCGTILEDYEKNEHVQKHVADLNNKIFLIENDIQHLNLEYTKNCDILNKINQKLIVIKQNRDNVKQELLVKYNEYQIEIQRDAQIDAFKDKLNEYSNNVLKCSEEIAGYSELLKTLNNDETIKNKEIEIIQHSIRLANNQFKSYLLENIITLLNNKLRELSGLLFENEIIQINGDSKLDIILGEKIYEQLSGGEQRKVDIAIIIAQRFLAQQMNSISSNILILDEVFDGLDDVSFSIVLDLLSDEIQDVESTFIISHRDIKEIPFDKIITITKNQNQISEVELS